MYVSAHELGHYLFGGGHIFGVSNLALMSGGPVWNSSRGMHSWERQKLGWINYTNKSTDGSVTMSDYMTADQVYRVPISSSEYFLIENRKKISPHDKAGDIGFYFYRVTDQSSLPPTIDVLCADGNWNFYFDNFNLIIKRIYSNPLSIRNEMKVYWYYDSNSDGKDELYACFEPVYYKNSAWGDNEDAFDLTFNNVLSPVSNPRSNNSASINFSIEVTGTNTIQFYFTNPYAGKPSKPQNLQASGDYNQEVTLNWSANTEPDMINGGKYKIYRAEVNGTGEPTTYNLIATINAYNGSTPVTRYTDYESLIYNRTKWLHYKITALDNTQKESVASEKAKINGRIPKTAEDTKIDICNGSTYSLSQNYPNPFNPSTTIEYEIPNVGTLHATSVQLIFYDALGREVQELVNETKQPGRYTIQFDGSNLTSGIYFVKMKANDASAGSTKGFTTTKKIVLAK